MISILNSHFRSKHPWEGDFNTLVVYNEELAEMFFWKYLIYKSIKPLVTDISSTGLVYVTPQEASL